MELPEVVYLQTGNLENWTRKLKGMNVEDLKRCQERLVRALDYRPPNASAPANERAMRERLSEALEACNKQCQELSLKFGGNLAPGA
jgi:hypothetical protein